MKDPLEDFLHQNKGEFDDKEPSDKVWANIRNTIFSSRSVWNSVVLWRAAAIILFGLSAYLLIPNLDEQHDRNTALSEFKEIEKFYFSQISDRVEEIEGFNGVEGLNGFTNDFHQLEAMYAVLKEEMKVNPNQKVKDALVLNLLIRIDLLNQQLYKIEGAVKMEEETKKVSV